MTSRFLPTRRTVLGVATGSALSLGVRAATPPAATPHRPILIVLFLRGGNDGLNTVVPLRLPSYASRRGVLAIPPGQCLSMNVGPAATTAWGLHPAVPGLGQAWRRGELAVVHGVGYPSPDRSHFRSEDIWAFGVRGSFAALGRERSGWVNRWAAAESLPPTGAIAIGGGARPTEFLGDHDLLAIGSLASFRFPIDTSRPSNHPHRLETVRRVLARRQAAGQHGVADRATRLGHALTGRVAPAAAGSASPNYPGSAFGSAVRDIARLVRAGFETRLYFTARSGFDTHAGQGGPAGTHADLLAEVDAALVALRADLLAVGAWRRTVVALVSEFGRRNGSNGSHGTDHGDGNLVLLTGGGVCGGSYGVPPTDADLQADALPAPVDFRVVYRELLESHLRAPAAAVAAALPEPFAWSGRLGFCCG